MTGYNEFPPFQTFKKVLQTCPLSALLYADLYKINLVKDALISIRKKETTNKFKISPTLFRNRLLSLSKLDMLSFEETPDFYLIKFYAVQ